MAALQDALGCRFGHPKPPRLINPGEYLFELVSDTPSGGVQEASETGFWMVSRRIWHRFWKLFGVIFGGVGIIFKRFSNAIDRVEIS